MKACVIGLAMSTLFAGCAPKPYVQATGPTRVIVDGDVAEWPAHAKATADGEYLYLRFSPPGPLAALQASDRPTRILVDADMDAGTGFDDFGVGAELEITLSPDPKGYGVKVQRYTPGVGAETIKHADIDFSFAPTYGSSTYEVRIGRTRAVAPLAFRNACRGVIVSGEGDGAWVMKFETDMPALASARATTKSPPIPAKPEGTVRVLSWNILKNSIEKDPEPFARVVRALAPDVVLVQEWDGADGDTLANWFNDHAPLDGDATWSGAARPSMGVGVATRYMIVQRQDGEFAVDDEWPTRCYGAVVRTPMGDVIAASTHLKCCGGYGSDEDERRVRETRAIENGLYRAYPDATPRTIVIGGDLNLVGSRRPLDTLAESLDVDGSPMAIANLQVFGDGARYTWTDDSSSFTPGRLDWVLVGDANADIADAFVLDARRLSVGTLTDAGIQPTDTSVSDHLPVVVDIRIK
ncbi:MAG: endonuclease/exonuclease/phosphatase family protein [Phycisphaerales bacterium]